MMSQTFENGSKRFPMAQNMGLEYEIKSLEYSEENLEFHSLKSSLSSYSPSTLFLTFRWVWYFWKWFQMISHGQKHGSRSQIQVSRRLRTEVIVSLLDVVLGLLQPLHPVHDLQVGLRLLKMVPNDCPCPKTWVSSMFQKQIYKVTYLAILRGMIFPTYFLTPP